LTVRWIEGPAAKLVAADVPSLAVVSEENLGPGETAVLSMALATGESEAIVDDKGARRLAARLGIKSRGSLGVLLLAKQQGRIPRLRPAIEAMQD